MNAPTREEALTLALLQAIDQRSDVSQRSLARRLDVALGLANLYLKRCVRKGWVKVQQAPANRYLYYLTPKGMSEKARLTARFLSRSFAFYRAAARSCGLLLARARAEGMRNLALAGASELAEIIILRAPEHGLTLCGLFDPRLHESHYFGLPVWREVSQVAAADAVVLTDLEAPERMHAALRDRIGPQRILIPDILPVAA